MKAAVILVALVAGTALYFMNASHQRELAALRQELETAKQELARRAREQAEQEARAKRTAQARGAEADAAQSWVCADPEELNVADDTWRGMSDEQRKRRLDDERLAQAQCRRAVALEQAGNGAEAIRLYVGLVRRGNGRAALRLAQIYEQGMPGVPSDRAEALKWYNAARVLGEGVPRQKP